MSFPNPYARAIDFSADLGSATNNAGINTELDNLGTALNAILTSLQQIQRSDTNLANQSVHVNALNGAVLALLGSTAFQIKGDWVTSTAYVIGDLVAESGSSYVCAIAHTSGVFATDLAAGDWILLARDFTVSSFMATVVDDATAADALTTLGVSTFIQTLLDDVDAAQALETLGFSAFIRGLVDDADSATALATLGAAAKAGSASQDFAMKAATAVGSIQLSDATQAVDEAGRFRTETVTGTTGIQAKSGGGRALYENTAAAGDFSTKRLVSWFMDNWDRTDSTTGTYTNGGLPYQNDSDLYSYTQNNAINSDNNLRTGASATATLASDAVSTVTVARAGNGYNTAPSVTFEGGGGTGAAATANITTGGVALYSIEVTNGGSGYSSAPTVVLTGGGGTGAAAGAIVKNNVVTGIVLTAAGSGYTSAPTVSFTGGSGGSGATATAYQARKVTSFTVTAGGSGYTSAPTVVVAAGPNDPYDVGPVVTLGRDVENPLAGSSMAGIYFGGRSIGSTFIDTSYASLSAAVVDSNPTAPKGYLSINTADLATVNAGNTPRLRIGQGVVTVNSSGESTGGDLGQRTINCDTLGADKILAGRRTGANHQLDAASTAVVTTPVLGIGFKSGSLQETTFYGVDAIGYSVTATGMTIGKNNTSGRSVNAAGTLNASGADYAEYVRKRSDAGPIPKGAICGVDNNGEITDQYDLAHSFVIKSTDPSFVGGDNWGAPSALGSEPPDPPLKASDESDDGYRARLEKHHAAKQKWYLTVEKARVRVDRIAFTGVVPCNVTGAAPGDYIVPAKLPDGGITGKAIKRSAVTFPQYRRALGQVWSIAPDGRANVAVGMK